MSSDTQQMESVTVHAGDTAVTLARRGGWILRGFAVIWVLAGAGGAVQLGTWFAAIAIGVLLVTVVIAEVVVRHKAFDSPAPPALPDNFMRQYNLVGIAQGIAIGAVVALFIATGLPHYIAPAVAFIVGAHFFPLARTFDQPIYTKVAIAMCLIAVVGAVAATVFREETGQAIAGLGSAVILWVGASWVTAPISKRNRKGIA